MAAGGNVIWHSSRARHSRRDHVNPCTVLQGMRDQADFEQVNLKEFAPLIGMVGVTRAVTEAQPADLSFFQQHAGAAFGPVDPGNDPQSARIFRHQLDRSDRLVPAVLPA